MTMDYRKNNFDFLRLILASFVIITHSYPLSGVKECDYLCQISNGQVGFSYIGVKGFFVIINGAILLVCKAFMVLNTEVIGQATEKTGRNFLFTFIKKTECLI